MYPQAFGKYVLEKELSRGGMARVLLATLKGAGGFEKKLVVKQIRDELAFDDQFVKRFVEEAKTTVALSHPNIVTVYELGVEFGTYYLAMELVEGMSLAEILRATTKETGKGLSPDEGAYVGVEICRALDYAHRRMKVVHRDITPRNVMVDEEGQIKVIDFGIAALSQVAGHEVFGSPGHMPPEQAEGKELTPATDVFAVAVLLLELWGGKAPFRRKDPAESEALMRTTRPKPSDIDVRLLALDDVFAKALALEPGERPQEAEDLGRALRKFLAGIDLHDVARGLGERVRNVRARPPAPASAKKAGLERPASKPSAATIRTRTFAAREEVAAWVPPVEERTRRIASTPPSKPEAAPREVIETVATRPLETARRPETEAKPSRRWAWVGAVAVAAAAPVVFFAVRAREGAATATHDDAASSAPQTAPPSTSTAATAATKTVSGVATIPATSVSAPSSATIPTTPASSSPALPTTSAPVLTVSAPVADKPKLVLLGDPGTVVSVDGASRGGCPVTVALEPGTHSVLFTFAATNESRGERVTLKAGDKATMRADFTGATPTIRIYR